MASPVYLWFVAEVFKWRSLAASLWSVICLPLVVCLMTLLLRFSCLHPLSWMSDAVDAVFSTQFLITLLTLTITVLIVTWFSLSYFTVKQEICSSRLSCILGLLRWSRFPFLVVCLLTGTLCGWSFANLADSPLTVYVKTRDFERSVLQEECLFLTGSGLFAGLCFYCSFFTKQKYHLSFPSVQRLKLFQARSDSKMLASAIAWQTLHGLKYYDIIYFLFGSLPRTWICSSFGISEDQETPRLDSFMGILSIFLLWKAYLISFMFTFILSFSINLIRIFQTEHLEFPITSVLESSDERTLPDALSCSYAPLLQHLAFYDLACLSKFGSPRLQEILSLSQPGGHPKVWMAVSGSTVAAIRELSNLVKEENWSIMSKVPVNPHRGGVANGNGFHKSASGDFLDTSITYRGDGSTVAANGDQTMKTEVSKPSFVSQWLNSLSSLPLLSQMTEQSQDLTSRRLFASCQIQIWAVESLSHIAVRAYTEDRFGIVQGSLPLLILSLLDLHETLEKHLKLSSSSRRSNGSQPSNDSAIRYKLQSVLKASLYRIVNTYKSHFEDLKLTPEEIRKLTPFIQYTT